ncbi:MAG TPA: SCO family protein, partial [Flavobacterium sp.]|nr:SCO family protein [Flavobacterium sp.]
MKKYLIVTMLSIVFLAACKKDNNNTAEATTENPQEISDMSIYNLPSTWTNQKGENLELVDLQENVLVMVMIYTSCKAACPRLVADMRHIEQTVKSDNKNKVKYVLVSIDPETDTPERLKAF